MKSLFGGLVGVLVISQISMADSDGSNHVQVIVNQVPAKVTAKKSVAKVSPKKIVTKKGTTPARSRQAVVATAKRPVTKAAAIVPVSNHDGYNMVPGKRVSLANSNAARANGYTSENSANQVIGGSSAGTLSPTIAVKIKKEEKKESESPWGFQIKSYNAENLDALENYGANRDYTIRAWERIYFGYNLNKDISLTLMPQFNHTWFQDQNRSQDNPGLNQSYAANLGDTALIFEDKKIAEFGRSGVTLSGIQMYYAPTSEAAQTAGELGETRTSLSVAKSVGKLDLKWTEQFRYYFQQFETNAFMSTKGTPVANVAYRLFSFADIGFNFSDKFNIGLETGFINESYYADSFNNTPAGYNNYVIMNPAFDYVPSKYLTFELGIWEVYNVSAGTGAQPANENYTPFSPMNATGYGAMSGSELYLQGTLKF